MRFRWTKATLDGKWPGSDIPEASWKTSGSALPSQYCYWDPRETRGPGFSGGQFQLYFQSIHFVKCATKCDFVPFVRPWCK